MTQQERKKYISLPGSVSQGKIPERTMISKLEHTCRSIYDRTYSFQLAYDDDYLKNAHPYNTFERLSQDLIIRQLSAIIGKIYSTRQSNRQAIIKFLKNYLKTHTTIKNHTVFILRLDIRRFYPSLDETYIIDRLSESSLLSGESLWLLEEILKNSSSGIPIGVGISAPLSEYAMELFDKSIIRMSGIWYYNRYVDDIVIICSDKNTVDRIWNDIPSGLERIGLEFNRKKSMRIAFGKDTPPAGYGHNEMTYLGYTFKYTHNALGVYLSDNKIKEIKRCVVASLYSWTNHHDFGLLCDRLNFLTGHSRFINVRDTVPTICGLKHNYPHLSSEGLTVLAELDRFMKKLIYSGNARIGGSFNIAQLKILSQYSFIKGYESKKWQNFSAKRISEIKRIW